MKFERKTLEMLFEFFYFKLRNIHFHTVWKLSWSLKSWQVPCTLRSIILNCNPTWMKLFVDGNTEVTLPWHSNIQKPTGSWQFNNILSSKYTYISMMKESYAELIMHYINVDFVYYPIKSHLFHAHITIPFYSQSHFFVNVATAVISSKSLLKVQVWVLSDVLTCILNQYP